MEYIARAKEVLQAEIEELQRVRADLDGGFSQAINAILEALRDSGKIVVTGMGKSLHVGQKIAATFTSTGTPAVILHPSEAMHGDLGIIQDGDIILALSFSGESEELVDLLPIIKRRRVKTIAICRSADSQLARLCDLCIPVPVEKEACPFNLAPTASTTAMMAVGDALAIVLLEARGFQKEDYAKLHPGGAIGRTLLLKVSDIMRGTDRIPMLRASDLGSRAIEAMTEHRSGAVAVVDENRVLLGIFTDGDLRRHITDAVPLADQPMEKLMTRNPVCIGADDLAVTALKTFETHNIDDLVVLNDQRQVVGLVDIQDLPKLKIL